MSSTISPVHPGEILAEEFLQPLGVSQYRLAKDTNVPPRRINEIVKGQRAVTVDTAIRLAKYFGTSEMFWLNLQARYDLDLQKAKSSETLASVRRFGPAPASKPSATSAPRRPARLAASATSGATRSAYPRKVK